MITKASFSIDSPKTIENNFGLSSNLMHDTDAQISVQLIKAENKRISLIVGENALISPVYASFWEKGMIWNIPYVKTANVIKLNKVPITPSKNT